MSQLTILLLLFFYAMNSYAQDSIRIYGRVTDFEDIPLDSVSVRLKDKNFTNLYETISDENGYYSMTVLKGEYNCIYAIKLEDYGKTKLEYWAWNIFAFNDLEINPKYERMEIYGMNAFEPQVGPHETYMLYFRPMSLAKLLEFQGEKNKKEMEQKAIAEKDTINIAPNSISKDEIMVCINNCKTEIVSINRVVEYARGGYIYGYLVQILKPKEIANVDYDKISIVLHSKETNEYGMGECFVKRTN